MGTLEFSLFIGPIMFGLAAWLRGTFFRRNIINKKKELRSQVILSIWACFIFCCFLFYDEFIESSKIFYIAFLYDAFLTVMFLFLLKQFKDDEIF